MTSHLLNLLEQYDGNMDEAIRVSVMNKDYRVLDELTSFVEVSRLGRFMADIRLINGVRDAVLYEGEETPAIIEENYGICAIVISGEVVAIYPKRQEAIFYD